jgi:hypothetical protein
MAGSIAANLHEGSRSEIIADYLFSTCGTVTPVRRQDDYGVDLYCTLTNRIGQRSVVTDYYSVQVKSTDDPWVIKGHEEIAWLTDHPTPLFLAVVDKNALTLSVYQTQARFLAAFWPGTNVLELVPSPGDQGRNPQWESPDRFDLSAPIIRVGLNDFVDRDRLAHIGRVLRFWVRLDGENCSLRRVGMLRLRAPASYRVNEVPFESPTSGIVELGNVNLTTDQLRKAVLTAVDVIDCVGHQLLRAGDREGAMLSAFLVRHTRQRHAEMFKGDMRWASDSWSPFEMQVAQKLNEIVCGSRNPSWTGEGFMKLFELIRALSEYQAFVEAPPAKVETGESATAGAARREAPQS